MANSPKKKTPITLNQLNKHIEEILHKGYMISSNVNIHKLCKEIKNKIERDFRYNFSDEGKELSFQLLFYVFLIKVKDLKETGADDNETMRLAELVQKFAEEKLKREIAQKKLEKLNVSDKLLDEAMKNVKEEPMIVTPEISSTEPEDIK